MTGSPLRRLGRRRVLAGAVAALVLVPGAVMTAATWTDGEYAKGTGFNAALVDLEGSPDDRAHFESHGKGAPAEMHPVVGSPDFYPGSAPSFTQFSLRLAAGASQGATISMAPGTDDADPGPGLRLRVVLSPDHGCTAATFGDNSNYLLGGQTGGTKTYGQARSTVTKTFTLNPGTAGAAGADTTLCFEFSLANDSTSDGLNNTLLNASWVFTAVGP